jgi:hypothetical protein
MNDSGKRDHLSKLLNVGMAIVEEGIAETNEEAWLRHLSTHPEDHHANVRIFNRQKPGADPERPRYKSS